MRREYTKSAVEFIGEVSGLRNELKLQQQPSRLHFGLSDLVSHLLRWMNPVTSTHCNKYIALKRGNGKSKRARPSPGFANLSKSPCKPTA